VIVSTPAAPLPDEPGVRLTANPGLLEAAVIALRCLIAAFYTVGAYAGWFAIDGYPRLLTVSWVAGYHVALAVYVARYRIPGRPIHVVELVCPFLDVLCITLPWIAIGDPQSPFWGVYLYALVAYTRRYAGRAFMFVASYVVGNLVFARLVIEPGLDANLVTMVILATVMAFLLFTIGAGWRQAEADARRLAETDPLTGIGNRRTFLECLNGLSRDPAASFAVLMLDLDDFKRLNDEHGHLHGDAVLVRVAHLLSERLREDDHLARYGGEEFIVALPGPGLARAAGVAERLRAAIAESGLTTVSIGCAARRPAEPAASVVRRADDALLAMKRAGKNGVLMAESAHPLAA
jgi:diguanylate cyclase (GGDEF)-like protein